MIPTPNDELQSGEHRLPLAGPPTLPNWPPRVLTNSASEASIPMEAAGKPLARAESRLDRDTVGAMDMAVALEADARQAAAVKLADEQALVRKAQAGDRLAFDELVRRYDRDVLRLALESGAPLRGRPRHLSGKLSAGLPEPAPLPVRVQLLHLALPDRDQRGSRPSAPPHQPPRGSGAGSGGSRRAARAISSIASRS